MQNSSSDNELEQNSESSDDDSFSEYEEHDDNIGFKANAKIEPQTIDDVFHHMNVRIGSLQEFSKRHITDIRVTMDKLKWDNLEFMDSVFVGVNNEISPKSCDGKCIMCRSNKPILSLFCTHSYCDDCLISHISVQLKSHSSANGVKCSECDFIMSDDFVLQNLENEKDQIVYKKSIIKEYAASSLCLIACPSSDCNLMIKNSQDDVKICACTYRFCSLCFSDDCLPVTCAIMNKLRSFQDELSQKFVEMQTFSCLVCANFQADPERIGFAICSACGIIERYPLPQSWISVCDTGLVAESALHMESSFKLKSLQKRYNELKNTQTFDAPNNANVREQLLSCYETLTRAEMFMCCKKRCRNILAAHINGLQKLVDDMEKSENNFDETFKL